MINVLHIRRMQCNAQQTRTVEQVFNAGLLEDVVLGPRTEIDTRIDAFFNDFRKALSLELAVDLCDWGRFGSDANNRRRASEPFLGQSQQRARAFLASKPGQFLVRALPYENRERRNDTHEILYFRDSGIHRRLIELTTVLDEGTEERLGKAAAAGLLKKRREHYVPKRWEAFVITTIVDFVGQRCTAFAYRHEETREIDLILEWLDRTPTERWAIEVTSRKFNTHPKEYFADECAFLGVEPENRFIVWRTDQSSGNERARGGVHALSLPAMLAIIRRRMLRG